MMSTDAIVLTVRICCVARAICLIELSLGAKEMRPGGMLNWGIAGLGDFSSQTALKRPVEQLVAVMPQQLFRMLLVFDAMVLSALFIWPGNGMLLAFAAALQLIEMKRHYLSYDGADEMILLCLTAIALGRLTRSPEAPAYFIAAEAGLAYFIAGIYKAASPFWKRGLALMLITRTRLFGQQNLSRALQQYPRAASAFEFAFVLWESIFVAALFAPPKVLLATLAAGLIFHLACAWVMGLNTFLWAFGATYSCVFFCNQQLRLMFGSSLSNGLSVGLAVAIGIIVAIMTFRIGGRVRIATPAAA